MLKAVECFKKECSKCGELKSFSCFNIDNNNPDGLRYECTDCRSNAKVKKSKRSKRSKKTKINKKKCTKCGELKSFSCFDIDSRTSTGLRSHCKDCRKISNKKYRDNWDNMIKAKVKKSLTAHNNKEEINAITLEEAKTLLDNQKKKCNHCDCDLQCISGTGKPNPWVASLDRVDVNIVGYKNNAQWLCISCNRGKGEMDNIDHLNKFKLRDDEIERLKKENENLKKENDDLFKINKNCLKRLLSVTFALEL